MFIYSKNQLLPRKEPWQRAFPNLWRESSHSDAAAVALKSLYERYDKELREPLSASLRKRGFIHRENLMSALQLAIEVTSLAALKGGSMGDSALVAGWKESLEVLQNRGVLEVKY